MNDFSTVQLDLPIGLRNYSGMARHILEVIVEHWETCEYDWVCNFFYE